MILSCHGDDIDPNDTGNGEVKVFAARNCMNKKSCFAVVRPVWQFFEFYKISNQQLIRHKKFKSGHRDTDSEKYSWPTKKSAAQKGSTNQHHKRLTP